MTDSRPKVVAPRYRERGLLFMLLGATLVGCTRSDGETSPGDSGTLAPDVAVAQTAPDGSNADSCSAQSEESPIALPTPTGTIWGTLRVPAGCTPFPVALIIAGSGSTDRDGNQIPLLDTDAYRELAAVLSGRGIASVRYDKRGVGESSSAAPPEVDLRFETYADDSARWLTDLGRDTRFSSTIVVGHSDGSQLGMLAMEKAPAQAFISLEGSGRAAGELIREQLT